MKTPEETYEFICPHMNPNIGSCRECTIEAILTERAVSDELRKENERLAEEAKHWQDEVARAVEYVAKSDSLYREHSMNFNNLKHFAKKAVEALKFAHNEINNSGVVRFHEDNSWSHEDCEYKNNPESGKCDFCYGYTDIEAILTDPTAKELIK